MEFVHRRLPAECETAQNFTIKCALRVVAGYRSPGLSFPAGSFKSTETADPGVHFAGVDV
jgi:hypothetical protein